MVFRNFNINIIVRLVFIILTSGWLTYEIGNPMKVYTRFFILSILIIQCILLVKYFNKINKELVRFLKLLKVNDASYRFSSDLKGNFIELAKILNNTADLLQNTRIEKERQYHFLQFVIEQINVGLIAYNRGGEIEFANKAFADLLDVKGIKHINELDKIDNKLLDILRINKPEYLTQHKLKIKQNFYQLLIQKKQFKFNNEPINLVSFQNISAELDQKELESWQKLIRVLTHEIMNSIAPITNLTYSIRRSLNENIEAETVQKDVIKEAIDDTNIIEKRSNSLMQFVENYRKLTKLSISSFSKVNVKHLIENSISLFREDLKNNNVCCDIKIDEQVEIVGDEKLLEQALINIVKNSIEAFNGIESPKLSISANNIENRLIIDIKDNGVGIEPDKLDDIFVPFYTSKEKGSGIGLSLVKQIINLHKGSISVSSELMKGTTFKIKL